MVAWLRIAWRLQPSVLAFSAVACLGLSSVAVWLVADMRSAAWRYPEVLIRESAAVGVATLGAVVLGVITLQRRRVA